ncbi:monocyte chemotactic protein 1B-like [Triplophysa rosa]|uniref:C-C motif chemokine 2-like n=3 Tax=Triplophysa rosa TaxID=992332 RepID=A0A9W7X3N0_TRIRA|nr:monocyte chemotactic protein 1B-like [Triplophysa rosa]KAI7813214.1 C-C motif chemokine 2-like [Triplophysa rosa]
MANLMSLLLLGLFCSVHLTSSGPAALDSAKSTCCPKNIPNKPIPLKKIVSVYWTSSSCPTKRVVFRSIKGKEICADPEKAWVNSHIIKVNKKRTTQTANTLGTGLTD